MSNSSSITNFNLILNLLYSIFLASMVNISIPKFLIVSLILSMANVFIPFTSTLKNTYEFLLIVTNLLILNKSIKNTYAVKVIIIALAYTPAPTAKPIHATKNIDAAVVNPFTLLLSFNIVPAPKKPIPETYCPANWC